MGNLESYSNTAVVKLILAGASGCGKTGAIASLIQAGYRIRFLEFDNGLDALVQLCKREQLDMSRVDFMSFRDKLKATATGTAVVGQPKAYSSALRALEKWEDETDPAEWGDETFLIIDSLTHASRAAMQWAKALSPTAREPRQWYHTAQGLIEDLLANVTSEAFNTNVIVISHIDVVDSPNAPTKHYVSSIGKAIGTKIPSYFNTLLLSETRVMGKKVERQIHTVPTNMMDLKAPPSPNMMASYPIETALADIVFELRGRPHPAG